MITFNRKKIKEIRISKGLTRSQFGKSVGTGRHLVACWENGTHVPSIALLLRICNVYSIAIGYFFEEEEGK